MELYYNHQLLNIGGIIKELVGVNRKVIKLIMKVIPIMNYYMCTSFGISKASYGSKAKPQARTGQGNITSGNVCRDKSCYVIEYTDRK